MTSSESGTLRAAGIRSAIGLVAGACSWLIVATVLRILPEFVRFELSWFLFTFGPGVAVAGRLTRDADPLRRVIIALGAGSAATPVVINLLGYAGWVAAFPYVALALAGVGVAQWRTRADREAAGAGDADWRADAVACAALVLLVAGIGFVVFGHRLATGPAGVVLYGEYDSADMGYYASEASDATHTIPPMAAYYSGHKLNAAYFPFLVLAMVHRFADVPILTIYYRWAWPTFLALSSLMLFALARSLTSRAAACLAVVLVVLGSDFSYLAAWFLPHAANDWDFLLWPTNFFAPTMQVQQFSTWTPSLVIFFAALLAIVRGLQTRGRGWLVLSAFLIGVLFEFKPFAYVVLMAALGAATVFSPDWFSRLRFAGTAVLGVAMTSPFLWSAARLDPADRRTKLVVEIFMMPRRMLIKTDLTGAFWDFVGHFTTNPVWRRSIMIGLAVVPFFLVGIGIRWFGLPGVWRAIRHGKGPDAPAWRLLGWGVLAGIAIPCVIVTEPYVDTLQFYLTGLYLLWIFTAVALVGFAQRRGRLGVAAAVVAGLLTLPSSLHYLDRKWMDMTREPKAELSRNEMAIAEYLRTRTDPETTVVLHDRPLSPSLMTIVSERRIVLGWDVRYSAVGGESRLNDVNAFFRSVGGPAAGIAILGRYHVTHLLLRIADDRVDPDVLSKLRLVVGYPDVALYEVPASLRTGELVSGPSS